MTEYDIISDEYIFTSGVDKVSKRKICVIGNMLDRLSDGQSIKTAEIVNTLRDRYGEENVAVANYNHARKNKFKLFGLIFSALKNAECVVLCARGQVLGSLVRACCTINKLFGRPIFYIFIGGAITRVITEHPEQKSILDKVACVFPETETMKRSLEDHGVKNVKKLPNFKHMRLYTPDELEPVGEPPYKLVYMSRIATEKGVFQMIDTLKRVNAEKVKFTLDIYGKIDDDIAERFEKLKSEFPPEIRYLGVADAWKVPELIHGYFAQLFPTMARTEGHPASLIDGFFAGLPTIAARWDSCLDMLTEGGTALTYTLGDYNELYGLLNRVYDDPQTVEKMRPRCLAEAQKYLPEIAAKPLFDSIDGALKK